MNVAEGRERREHDGECRDRQPCDPPCREPVRAPQHEQRGVDEPDGSRAGECRAMRAHISREEPGDQPEREQHEAREHEALHRHREVRDGREILEKRIQIDDFIMNFDVFFQSLNLRSESCVV